MTKFNDLQDRLVTLAANSIGVAEMLPNTRAGQHMSEQVEFTVNRFGYIIAGHWLTVYEVKPMERAA